MDENVLIGGALNFIILESANKGRSAVRRKTKKCIGRVSLESLESRQLLSTAEFPGSYTTDTALYDPQKNRLYVLADNNSFYSPHLIYVYDIESKNLISKIEVAKSLYAIESYIDLSNDGKYLYSMQGDILQSGEMRLIAIDTETFSQVNLGEKFEGSRQGKFDLNVSYKGDIYITFSGVNQEQKLYVAKFDSQTGKFINTASFSSFPSLRMTMSGDKKTMLIENYQKANSTPGSSHSDFYLYDIVTDTIIAKKLNIQYVLGKMALNYDGTVLAIPNGEILDRNLNVIGTFDGVSQAFRPYSTQIFSVDSDGSILAKDYTTNTPISIDVDKKLVAEQYFNTLPEFVISEDAKTAFGFVGGGYSIIDLGEPPIAAYRIVGESIIQQNSTLNLKADYSIFVNGRAVLEWDYDYNGENFDIDHTGDSILINLGSTPRTALIASRLKIGARSYTAKAQQIKVANFLPTANIGAVIDNLNNFLSLSLSNIYDVPEDIGTLKFSFDLDNDGIFETDTSSVPSVSFSLLENLYGRSFLARITDQHGGFSDLEINLAQETSAVISEFIGTVTHGAAVALSAEKSRTTGSPIVSYEWDLDYDGSFDVNTTGKTTTLDTKEVGKPLPVKVALRITTEAGEISIAEAPILISGTKPTLTLLPMAPLIEGSSGLLVTARLRSPEGIDLKSIGNGDLIINSQVHGFAMPAELVSVKPTDATNTTVDVVYRFVPPGGVWLSAMGGEVQIKPTSGAIRSTNGLAVSSEFVEKMPLAVAALGPDATHRPDLVLSSVSAPNLVLIGGKTTLSASLSNVGSAPLNGKSSLKFVFSKDAFYDLTDKPLATVPVNLKLGSGAQLNVNKKITVPRGMENDSGYVIGVVDAEGKLAERTKANNRTVGLAESEFVTSYFDLAPNFRFNQTQAKRFQNFTITFGIQNLGNSAAEGSFRYSITSQQFINGVWEDVRTQDSSTTFRMKPNQKLSRTTSTRFDNEDQPGLHRIVYRIFDIGPLPDKNPENNVVYSNPIRLL